MFANIITTNSTTITTRNTTTNASQSIASPSIFVPVNNISPCVLLGCAHRVPYLLLLLLSMENKIYIQPLAQHRQPPTVPTRHLY